MRECTCLENAELGIRSKKFILFIQVFCYGNVQFVQLRGKVNFSLCLTKHHTMKTYWDGGGIAPRSLNFGTIWRGVVSFTLRPFIPLVNILISIFVTGLSACKNNNNFSRINFTVFQFNEGQISHQMSRLVKKLSFVFITFNPF
jgi:hypothetical protein